MKSEYESYVDDFKKMVGDAARWSWLIDMAREVDGGWFTIVIYGNKTMVVRFEWGISKDQMQRKEIRFDNTMEWSQATKGIINGMRICVISGDGVDV